MPQGQSPTPVAVPALGGPPPHRDSEICPGMRKHEQPGGSLLCGPSLREDQKQAPGVTAVNQRPPSPLAGSTPARGEEKEPEGKGWGTSPKSCRHAHRGRGVSRGSESHRSPARTSPLVPTLPHPPEILNGFLRQGHGWEQEYASDFCRITTSKGKKARSMKLNKIIVQDLI